MHLLNTTTRMPFEIIFDFHLLWEFNVCMQIEKMQRHTVASPGNKNPVTRQPSTKLQVTGHTVKVASNKANELNNSTVFHQENFIVGSDFYFSLIASRLLLMKNLLNLHKETSIHAIYFTWWKISFTQSIARNKSVKTDILLIRKHKLHVFLNDFKTNKPLD